MRKLTAIAELFGGSLYDTGLSLNANVAFCSRFLGFLLQEPLHLSLDGFQNLVGVQAVVGVLAAVRIEGKYDVPSQLGSKSLLQALGMQRGDRDVDIPMDDDHLQISGL